MTAPKVIHMESYGCYYVRADVPSQTKALKKLLSDPRYQRDNGKPQAVGQVLKGRGIVGEKVPTAGDE